MFDLPGCSPQKNHNEYLDNDAVASTDAQEIALRFRYLQLFNIH